MQHCEGRLASSGGELFAVSSLRVQHQTAARQLRKRGVLLVLGKEGAPFTRAWCCFEQATMLRMPGFRVVFYVSTKTVVVRCYDSA